MISLQRYFTITSVWWQRGLTYRLTWFAYRVGEILETLILILMWSRLFIGEQQIGGYTKNEMITYVLLSALFSTAVRSFAREIITREIYTGTLSMYLTKPFSYIAYNIARDIGRNAGPLIASLSSNLILILFFANTFTFSANTAQIFIAIAMLLLAFLIESFVQYLTGFATFWLSETEAIFEVIARVKRIFTGGYFPISLLPATLARLIIWLPFAYSAFIPAQLVLNKISSHDGLVGLGIQAGWVILLYIFIKITWHYGLRRYEATNI